ncbi:MAG: hypothetical protein AB3N14_01960 [Flavobacteriaceae bacterium]
MKNKIVENSKSVDLRDTRGNRHSFWKGSRRHTLLRQIRFA